MVLRWENDLQLKKSQDIITKYLTYRSIVIISYRDLYCDNIIVGLLVIPTPWLDKSN